MGDSPEEKRERAAKVKGFELKRFERRFYLSEGETKAWSNMQNLSSSSEDWKKKLICSTSG